MKEGTVFMVFGFESEWPVNQPVLLADNCQENARIKLIGLPLGHFKVEIQRESYSPLYFISQRVCFINKPRFVLCISWNEYGINLRINGIILNSFIDNSIQTIECKQVVSEDKLSWEEVDATRKCREWIDWRIHRYSQPKLAAKLGRRISTFQEQVNQLVESCNELKEQLASVQKGQLRGIQIILPALRALLFWPDKSGPYNPLLIRIAGVLQVPLPVYALPSEQNEEFKQLISKAVLQISNNKPSIIQKMPNQVLMDFQEWLHLETFVLNEKSYRMKDVIFEAANTMSIAHFDDDIPLQIDFLKNNTFFGFDGLAIFVISVTETTIALAEYLVCLANKEKS